MGEFPSDVVDTVRFGLAGLREARAWKYYAGILLLQVLLGFVIGAGIVLSLLAFSGVAPGLAASPGYWSHLFSSANPSLLFGALIGLLLVGGVLLVLFLVGYMYLYSNLARFALETRGLPAVPVNWNKSNRTLLLFLHITFHVLFFWKDRRFLWAPFLGLLGFLLASFSPFFTLFGVLGFLTYFFILFYFSMRLAFAYFAFLQEDLTYAEAIDFSWRVTKDRVLGLCARLFFPMLVLYLPFVILFLPLAALPGVVAFIGQSVVQGALVLAILFAQVHVYSIYLKVNGLLEPSDAPRLASPAPTRVRARRRSGAPKKVAAKKKPKRS